MPFKKDIPRICQVCSTGFMTDRNTLSKGYGKFCSANCRTQGTKRTVEERFWEKVSKKGTEECWEWIGGSRNSLGYGGFFYNGQWSYAHRVSYELNNGCIPQGFEVLHKCDNPSCINPNHLLCGTHAENMADSKAKGRIKGGFYNIHPENRPLGEKHGLSKLTDKDIRDIRHKFEKEGRKVGELSREYGMGHAQIGAIARRKAWVHVLD